MKITSDSTLKRQKRQKAQNGKKTSFPKELVENADLHNPLLNKMRTTNEYCVKYDFVASLISLQFNPIITNSTKWLHHSNNSSAVASELFMYV